MPRCSVASTRHQGYGPVGRADKLASRPFRFNDPPSNPSFNDEDGKDVDLFEYQARDLFAAHGVPVLDGAIAQTPEEAEAAAAMIGPKSGGVTVVKAQVKAGGRGKAGGVKLAKSPAEAKEHAQAMLGMQIKGLTVNTVMITQGARIAEEYYFSILLDRANRTYLAMCSKEGGIEIEHLAVERPEALARIPVDPN